MYRFILLLTVFLFSCSNDSNNKNNENNQNNEADAGSDEGTQADTDNSNAEYASDYSLRVHTMVFDTGTAAAPLNGIVADNLDQTLEFPIIILLYFSMIDPDAGTLNLRGGAGLKTDTDEEYEWEPVAGTTDRGDGTLVASNGEFAAEIELFEFIATFVFEDDVSKVTIPIRELDISGNLTLLDGGAEAELANGRLQGFLTLEDGDTTLISLAPGAPGIPLTMVFKTSNLNYNTSTGEVVEQASPDADAWFITGDITGKATTIK